MAYKILAAVLVVLILNIGKTATATTIVISTTTITPSIKTTAQSMTTTPELTTETTTASSTTTTASPVTTTETVANVQSATTQATRITPALTTETTTASSTITAASPIAITKITTTTASSTTAESTESALKTIRSTPSSTTAIQSTRITSAPIAEISATTSATTSSSRTTASATKATRSTTETVAITPTTITTQSTTATPALTTEAFTTSSTITAATPVTTTEATAATALSTTTQSITSALETIRSTPLTATGIQSTRITPAAVTEVTPTTSATASSPRTTTSTTKVTASTNETVAITPTVTAQSTTTTPAIATETATTSSTITAASPVATTETTTTTASSTTTQSTTSALETIRNTPSTLTAIQLTRITPAAVTEITATVSATTSSPRTTTSATVATTNALENTSIAPSTVAITTQPTTTTPALTTETTTLVSMTTATASPVRTTETKATIAPSKTAQSTRSLLETIRSTPSTTAATQSNRTTSPPQRTTSPVTITEANTTTTPTKAGASRYQLNLTVPNVRQEDFPSVNSSFEEKVEERIKSRYPLNISVKATVTKVIAYVSQGNSSVVIMAINIRGIENFTEICRTFESVFEVGKSGTLQLGTVTVTDVKTESLDCCVKETVGEENFKGILKYEITYASSIPVTKQCPFNESQTVDRFCRKNFPYKAEWTEVDFSLCSPKPETTKKLLSLNQENITTQNVAAVSQNLKEIVDSGTLENAVDVVTVTSLVIQIADSLNSFQGNETETDAITENILDVTDKYLVTDQKLLNKANEENNTSSNFLRSLDTIAIYIAKQGRQKVFKKRNMALAIQNRSSSFTFIAKDESRLLDIQTADGEATNQPSLGRFFVPQSLLTIAKTNQVYSYIYRSDVLFSQNEPIQSIIMAVSVAERNISNLQDPVVISFQDKTTNKTKNNKISTCQFWEPERNAWSREGCKTLPRDNSGTVTCKCTHLTNFALLLDDDLSETTTQLKELDQENITSENVVDASKNLTEIVSNATLNNKVDIVAVTSVVTKIINSLNGTQRSEKETIEITNNILDVADRFLLTDQEVLEKSNEDNNTSATFLRNLDVLAVILTNQSTNQTVFRRQNIALAIRNKSSSFTFIAEDKNNLLDIQTADGEITNQASLAKVFIPQSLLIKAESNQVYSFVFRSGLLFSDPLENETVQSIIMSASVPERKIYNLSDPVVITFQDQNANKTIKNQISTCQFWVPERKVWSREGCNTLPGKFAGTVKCECTHLTNFALMLDVDQSGSNPLSLKIITWIGCGISLLGLVITILTYSVFSNLRKKLTSKILLCLCSSLVALLIVFLAGIERVTPRIGCQFIAALMQYFLLTTFFWMTVEGWNLYRNFVKIYVSRTNENKFMIKSSIFAWAVPLVITAITAGVATDYLGPKTEDDIQFCVVHGLPFYIGIVVPVVLVAMKNLIILALTLHGISKNRIKKDQKREVMTSIRIAFTCSVLLGTAWVFAIFAVGNLRDVFQWLFCIFNSLQGLFIFLFYTVRNLEARKQWMRIFGLQSTETYSLRTDGSDFKSRKTDSLYNEDSLKMVDMNWKKRSTSS